MAWLNELEWVEGRIYANIWQRECIVIIEPQAGCQGCSMPDLPNCAPGATCLLLLP